MTFIWGLFHMCFGIESFWDLVVAIVGFMEYYCY